MVLKILHRLQKTAQHEPHEKQDVNPCDPEE